MSDLSGRTCLVTGATRGIGRATAEALAKLGATVIIHGRDSAAVGAVCRATLRMSRGGGVTGAVGDFASLKAVQRMAEEVAAQHPRLDLLVNNAGTAARQRRTTVDGFEWVFAVNHLAPFLLTKLLLPTLTKNAPARIVNVASMAYRRADLDFADLQWERRKYQALQVYSASKLANVLFTLELARRLAGTLVTANCVHPGLVATNIFAGFGGGLGKLFGVLLKPLFLSPAAGARTSVYAASAPELATVSGRFFDKSRDTALDAIAQDAAAARRLWAVSEELVARATA
ncbi:MAG TPA: SDR family NAD(P)-dependent oxidoreductase [Gammaproteobacteria bacterium]|jgi:NAD(P)-dependent dehydrogenase (short-subunit alcohol dehydrogenase family)|nr:SDR family NAD(P)-dependent oxidoreductase [Gammaproteobacteria bacterium]